MASVSHPLEPDMRDGQFFWQEQRRGLIAGKPAAQSRWDCL